MVYRRISRRPEAARKETLRTREQVPGAVGSHL